MGIGSAIALVKEAIALDHLQRATSFPDMKLGYIKSSTEQAGLTLDARTLTAVLSATFFILGCAAGLIGLHFRISMHSATDNGLRITELR
jgi:Ca2+/Na+ antiporter